MRAVVASLFEKELEEVPDFKSFGERWFSEMYSFYHKEGCDICYFDTQRNPYKLVKEALAYDGGIGGYFDATVNSQTFEDTTHAVVVDSSLNIVHDPNPNQKALKLKPEDVISVMVVNKKKWYIEDGKLVKEDG